MDISWIKIPTDIFDDEKILLVEQLPEYDSIICLFLKLLCKSKQNKGIREYKLSHIELTDDNLGLFFNVNKKNINTYLKKLEDIGVIKRKNNVIEIIPFWLDKHDRNSTRYRLWRASVFKRDGYKCRKCGTKKDIQAHHIITWRDSKNKTELRYDVKNGMTLCKSCHLKEHGGKWR